MQYVRFLLRHIMRNKANNIDIVRNGQKEFASELPRVILARRSEHFFFKLSLRRVITRLVNLCNRCS